jgi:hypothetical protein
MRSEECKVVSDGALDPLGFHIGVLVLTCLQGRLFPGDGAKVWRRGKQLLRDRRAIVLKRLGCSGSAKLMAG